MINMLRKSDPLPNIGDEIRGKDIGKVGYNAERLKHVWVKCPNCLEERWAQKKSTLIAVGNRIRLCAPCVKNTAKTFRINPSKEAEEGRI